MLYEIRSARPEDVPATVALVRDVLAEFGLTFGVGSPTDAELEALPDSYVASGGAFWVAESGELGIVGCSGLARLDEETFELRKMYLRPVARGCGLGRRLLDEAIHRARERRARRIVLDTLGSMTAAIALYERRGFVRDDQHIRSSRCSRGYRLEL